MAGLADLFGGNSTPSINIDPLVNLVKQRTQQQKDILANQQTQLGGLNAPLQSNLDTTETSGATAAANRSAQFLKDIGQTTDLQNRQLSDVLKQRVLGAVPEAENAARESLAATGGLQRGYAGSTLAAIPQEAIAKIGEGEQALASQSLTAKNTALNQVYNLDEQYIQEKTGLDKQTILELYNSGRTDLINQANQLLGITGQESSDIIGLNEYQQSQQVAQQQAENQNRTALLNTLLGLGGTAIGAATRLPLPPTANLISSPAGAVGNSSYIPVAPAGYGGQ